MANFEILPSQTVSGGSLPVFPAYTVEINTGSIFIQSTITVVPQADSNDTTDFETALAAMKSSLETSYGSGNVFMWRIDATSTAL